MELDSSINNGISRGDNKVKLKGEKISGGSSELPICCKCCIPVSKVFLSVESAYMLRRWNW